MTELLTFVNIGDMYLYHRTFHAADAILQGNAGMCVGTSVEYHAVIRKTYFLQLVDELTLDVALVIFDFHIRVFSLQLRQLALEGVAAVNAWFANAKKVQVRTIDNLYLHNLKYFCSYMNLFL